MVGAIFAGDMRIQCQCPLSGQKGLFGRLCESHEVVEILVVLFSMCALCVCVCVCVVMRGSARCFTGFDKIDVVYTGRRLGVPAGC